MSKEIEFKIDNMNNFYTSRVWRLGCDIYKEGKVIEAYALNEFIACFTVRGSIDYTVVIQKKDAKTNIECNCPYMGFCKHEVAVLQYLDNHPRLEVTDKPYNLGINNLDEFKLLVEEQLYEMDNDDDDMDLYDRTEMLCGIIEAESNVEYKITMLIHLWGNFPVDSDVWKIMIESYKEYPETVKRVIQNMEDVILIGMIDELLEVTISLNQEVYKELIDCLRKKYDELNCIT